MITEALLHCAGIGPARLARLHELGIRSWTDVLQRQDVLSAAGWSPLAEECRRCLAALDAGEIRYFTSRFAPRDRWRILSHFLDQASYVDIETIGLEHDAAITVISCWHDGRLHNFVEHENLDEFLELLDEIRLLVSFNGSSFDVPRILDAFHIPELPCAHLDLRWICFHQGQMGGLKEIANRAGIVRPADLHSADGELAVRLWFAWRDDQDVAARELLIRYCAADVLMLMMLAHQQAGRDQLSLEELWSHLPAARAAGVASHSPVSAATTAAAGVPTPAAGGHQTAPPRPRHDLAAAASGPAGTFGAMFESMFGQGSPKVLRARRSRLIG